MNHPYTTAGLNRLYQAIQHQAEQEFLEAMNGLLNLTEEEEQEYLNYYRGMRDKAEQRLVFEYEQSRGKM